MHEKNAYVLRSTSGKHLNTVHTWYSCQLCSSKAHSCLVNKLAVCGHTGRQSVCPSGGNRGQETPEITPAGSHLGVQAAEYCQNQKTALFFSVATLHVCRWLITRLLGHVIAEGNIAVEFST